MSILKKTARYFAGKNFCKTAINEHADLSALKEKPTFSMVVGMIMIAFSYVIGLPAVIALGAIAIWLEKPLIGIIGGPLIYGISTLMFIIGIKLAGKKYIKVLVKWMMRVMLEKILGEEAKTLAGPCPENK